MSVKGTGFTFIDNNNQPFIRYWTSLMKSPYLMSKDEMELYSIMYSRQTLSQYSYQNGDIYWKDDGGIFFVLDADQITKFMGIGNRKWRKLKKSLIKRQLLTEKVDKGKSTKYYLKLLCE
ncbi:hypothetical protein [Clostridium sp. UBA4548]|uniref:hypothetical protein n=1 Tax=Clostridium sp. UBA4548 TaxID=1946361 RepID=UPI0025C687BA|nr:hypothetical protein [Clostridium sp. UBA4548]